MLVRIDIRPETKQDICRIEDIVKFLCAFHKDIHGQDKDAIYRDLFGEDWDADRFFAFEANKEVGLAW